MDNSRAVVLAVAVPPAVGVVHLLVVLATAVAAVRPAAARDGGGDGGEAGAGARIAGDVSDGAASSCPSYHHQRSRAEAAGAGAAAAAVAGAALRPRYSTGLLVVELE